jgi:hypothetical protein
MTQEAILEQKLRALFPEAHQHAQATEALARYGIESHEQEPVRVRLAALKLAGADLGQLRAYVDAAKRDFRDVLAWAESPAQMKADSWRLPAAEQQALIAQDRKQYDDWLRA